MTKVWYCLTCGGLLADLCTGTLLAAGPSKDPVIITILGTGLKPVFFNPTDEQIESASRDFAEAGFTMSWAISPQTWIKHGLLEKDAYFAFSKKVAAVQRRHGIGSAFGFHWHNLLPKDPEQEKGLYGEKLNPETSELVKANWNYGSEKALQAFSEKAKTLFSRIGPFEMFYADEILLGGAGKKSHVNRPSTYWTSPTYSTEALASFRHFLARKKYPRAFEAKFPVTTVAVEPGVNANMGLPAIRITEQNKDRLVADNNWSESPLWQYWYHWRTGLYTRWLDTVTTLAYKANKNNPNWMGCYFEMPMHWMIPELGIDIQEIAQLPHVDYLIAGYTTGERYAPLKQIAETAGNKWGLQIEVSRYGRKEGMPVEYIENTFKKAVNDGASLITCYAGMSFRTDLKTPPLHYQNNGWSYKPEQAKTWKACIQWLKQGRGLKRPHFTQEPDNDKN